MNPPAFIFIPGRDSHLCACARCGLAWDVLLVKGAVFQVRGAGTDRVNGYYRQDGERNNKPLYKKIGDEELESTCILLVVLTSGMHV